MIALVVMECRTKVPAINAVHCPSAASIGGFMNEDFRARGREGSLVIVEGSVELSLRGQSWIDPRRVHEV